MWVMVVAVIMWVGVALLGWAGGRRARPIPRPAPTDADRAEARRVAHERIAAGAKAEAALLERATEDMRRRACAMSDRALAEEDNRR